MLWDQGSTTEIINMLNVISLFFSEMDLRTIGSLTLKIGLKR